MFCLRESFVILKELFYFNRKILDVEKLFEFLVFKLFRMKGFEREI